MNLFSDADYNGLNDVSLSCSGIMLPHLFLHYLSVETFCYNTVLLTSLSSKDTSITLIFTNQIISRRPRFLCSEVDMFMSQGEVDITTLCFCGYIFPCLSNIISTATISFDPVLLLSYEISKTDLHHC